MKALLDLKDLTIHNRPQKVFWNDVEMENPQAPRKAKPECRGVPADKMTESLLDLAIFLLLARCVVP